MGAVLIASLTCFAVAGVFVGGGFAIGRLYERQQPTAPVFVLPHTSMHRHPSHHHRPALHERTATDRRHLRVVTPIYDFEQENEPA